MIKMTMIDRYIYAVTEKLPQTERQDIASELRGLIEDMLDERSHSSKSKDDQIEEVLLELGHPTKLANKYRHTKRYLIGPELFDSYILVLKIVLIVISSIIGISFLIQTLLNPTAILNQFIEMIISVVTTLPIAFGWTTLSFVIGQYSNKFIQKNEQQYVDWKITDLPHIPSEKRQIKQGESIVSIIFYTIFIVLFALSSDHFGVWIFHDGFSGVIPFLNEQTYHTYLPLIILIFGFGILKECFKLISGKWTYKLTVFTTVVNVLSIIAVLIMINNSGFWNPNFMNELVSAEFVTTNSEAFHVISTIWSQLTFWILFLMVVGLVWDAVNGLIKVRKK